MEFEKPKTTETVFSVIGFVFSYFLFTTILYFLLFYLKKIPFDWTYLNVGYITLSVVFLGFLIKRFLK